jgi:hypothetical protein
MGKTRRQSKKLPQVQLKASPDKKASSGLGKKKLSRFRTSKQYFALPAAQQEKWDDSVHVVAKMRSGKISLTKAAREFGLSPKAVLARVGSALRKTKSGRYVARPSDKLLRVLGIPGGPEGTHEVAIKDSAVASKLGEYSNAVRRFIETGDASGLKKFRRLKLLDEKGKRIKLLTDLAELQRLGSASRPFSTLSRPHQASHLLPLRR